MHALLVAVTLLSSAGEQGASLKYSAPPSWTSRPASSSMRVAEFIVPKAQGDPEDAEVVIFFFGGGGGSVDANIQRWIGQFQPAAGAAKGEPQRETFNVGPLKVTAVDVSGTYVAETRPGSGTRLNKPDFRMRAAVVETPGGPYFVKFTGPAASVQRALPAFDQFVKSLRYQ